MGLRIGWLFVVLLVVLVFVLIIRVVYGPGVKAVSQVSGSSTNTVSGPTPLSIGVPVYVVGPSSLIQRLTNAGINQCSDD